MKFHKVKTAKRSSFESLTILLLCFCFFLSSCADSSSKINEHSLYLPESVEEDISQKTDFFFFIIPKDASPELITSAKALCYKFSTENDVKAEVYFDDEQLPIYKEPRFILIGDTVYSSSQKAIANLNRDDYVCLSVGKDVVIGGKSSSASILAIERFAKDVLPYFDGESGISAASAFEFLAEYPYKDLTINGYSLSDHTFVYPSENSMHEMELVYLLREKLADTCGAYPKVLSDKEADPTSRLICVGNCFGQTRQECQIAYEGNSVKLFASSQNALAQAVKTLLKKCGDSQSVTLRDSTVIESKTPVIDFASVFPNKIESESDLAGIAKICKKLKQELPMLVCFDIPTRTELEAYKNNLNEYTYIGNGLFVLSCENEIIWSETTENLSVADLRIGDGLEYRVIVADTRNQNDTEISDSAISKISDTVTTVLFTLSKDTEKISFERDDIILELEDKSGDRVINTKVFSPVGSATAYEKTVILNHALLKEAVFLTVNKIHV